MSGKLGHGLAGSDVANFSDDIADLGQNKLDFGLGRGRDFGLRGGIGLSLDSGFGPGSKGLFDFDKYSKVVKDDISEHDYDNDHYDDHHDDHHDDHYDDHHDDYHGHENGPNYDLDLNLGIDLNLSEEEDDYGHGL